MSDRKKIGDVVDALGCQSSMADGDLVTDVIVVMKVVEPDGSVRLSTCWSEGISWIERVGMLRVAERYETSSNEFGEESDE